MPHLPLEPDVLAKQLAQLSSSHVGKNSRWFFTILQQINQSQYPHQKRAQLLELLREPVFSCTQKLEQAFTGADYPLAEPLKKSAKLCIGLHQELALGYERLLTDLTGTHPKNEKAQAHAGQRALSSLGYMLLHMAQLGEPVASSIWRRSGRIFLQGSEEGWLNHPVPESISDHDFALTPGDQYKCNVAFMALTPTRFSSDSARHLFDYLLLSHRQIDIHDSPNQPCWSVDPNGSQGPIHSSRRQAIQPGCQFLSLTVPDEPPLPAAAAKRLRFHGRVPDSVHNYPINRKVNEVWIGLETIETEMQRSIKSETKSSGDDWLSIPNFELASEEASETFDPPSPHSRSLVKRWLDYVLYASKTASFALLDGAPEVIRVGELVGLKMLDESLQLAVVRWIQAGLRNQRSLYGLELIRGATEFSPLEIPKQWWGHAGLLVKDERTTTLILHPTKLKHGSLVKTGASSLKVAKLLEWDEDYCAYQLSD